MKEQVYIHKETGDLWLFTNKIDEYSESIFWFMKVGENLLFIVNWDWDRIELIGEL